MNLLETYVLKQNEKDVEKIVEYLLDNQQIRPLTIEEVYIVGLIPERIGEAVELRRVVCIGHRYARYELSGWPDKANVLNSCDTFIHQQQYINMSSPYSGIWLFTKDAASDWEVPVTGFYVDINTVVTF